MIVNKKIARSNHELSDEEYVAEKLLGLSKDEYFRLLTLHQKVYDKINIVAVFLGAYLSVYVHSLDFKEVFESIKDFRTCVKVLVLFRILCQLLSFVFFIVSLFMTVRLLKSKDLYFLDLSNSTEILALKIDKYDFIERTLENYSMCIEKNGKALIKIQTSFERLLFCFGSSIILWLIPIILKGA